ncbi:MaoC/PaaZ C-terminal domain-containing protein [Actinoplanes sp. NPDC026619]|uniref:MaoC/PaaZ C-terminal domain-containing protein n=1 Tax=Actinoplanes sp. NPDC026619 TaxID=3155798 RepID=UPI0033C97521
MTSENSETQTFRVTRADLVRYAGASGDFNPIHWSERFANSVGLPGVIAHGMFTMALVGRAVTAWAGAADSVVEFSVRFARPVPVPDTDEGTEVVVTVTVKGETDEGHTKLSLVATCQGEKVLSLAQAVVRKR